MNDCCRGASYFFSDEDQDKLQNLAKKSQGHCAVRSGVFINHATFYPKLRPAYADLAPLHTLAAQQAGAIVHAGEAYVKEIQLRDHMHFAPESTPMS